MAAGVAPGDADAAKVALIAGSSSYNAHVERKTGFLSVINELFPQLTVVGLREHRQPHAGIEITRGQVIFRENLP